MKKTLIIITAITLLFTACNADATSGLFRTATQAREAIDIQYKQILGIDSFETLYFRTVRGIFSLEKGKSASNAQLIVASKEGNIVGETALTTDGKILYKTSKSDVTIYEYTSGGAPTAYTPTDSKITLTRLMPNGKVVARKEANSGDFWVTDIINFPNDPIADEKVNLVAGYDYYGLYTPSNYKDPTSNQDFLLSFINSDSEYAHHYFNGSALEPIDDSIGPIANYAKVGDNLYVLSTKGELFLLKSGSYESADNLDESTLNFKQYGLFYPIEDAVNNKVHFITSPDVSDSMTVFTVDKSNPQKSTTITTNGIKFGYAATLKDTHIVSSLQLTDDSFLIATEKHGMYSVKVDPEKVNKNDSSNVVKISKAEEYEF